MRPSDDSWSVKRKTEMARAKVQERQAAYRTIFCDATGQVSIAGWEVLRDILKFGHVYHSIASSDPLEAARREGRRELALRIANTLYMDEQQMLTFLSTGRTPFDA